LSVPFAVYQYQPASLDNNRVRSMSSYFVDTTLDYLLYLDLLKNNCAEERLSILAYCLMPNHIHLIAMPERETALAQALARINAAGRAPPFGERWRMLREILCEPTWPRALRSTNGRARARAWMVGRIWWI